MKKSETWKRAGKEPPLREDFSAEDEESSLKEAVTRERLVKTQQAGKDLEFAVVICRVWSSECAVITSSSELCV
jgi:hypothetical protein